MTHGERAVKAALVASPGLVIDCFAGPGGWDEGVLPLGIRPVGIELDHAACLTAAAAGHARIRADVEDFPLDHLKGRVTGLIMSPPCQDFSLAGKQAGIEGEKGRLITQVLRWTHELMPTWVACEQVPPCIDLWAEYGQIMRGWGYKTWHGIVNAADYGVPQTRKRAILLASLDRQPTRPERTHARGGEVDLFRERLPWITMAEALDWNADMVVRTGNNSMVTGRTGSRAGDGDVQPYERSLDEPAPTLDTMVGSKWTVRWPHERPATTICGDPRVFQPGWRGAPEQYAPDGTYLGERSGDNSVRVTVQEAGVLQSFRPDYPWQGMRSKQFQQVGNAVPPRLALHVVAEALGVQVPDASEAEVAA